VIEHVDEGMQASTVAADAPVVGWATGPLGAVQAADREIARATALRARAVAAFAASRPASVDRAQGERDASAAARRLAKALTERGISLRPERAEGMACVSVVCTMPEARALYAALTRYADAVEDDPDQPPRTRGQKMVDALLDLVLRPGETDLPRCRSC
jgi:uncharacterized protein DUF222